MDRLTKEQRSAVMSRIRGKGNKTTEMALIGMLRANRIKGWRRQWPVAGRPDVAFPKEKVAVFIDGCFWHQCPIHKKMPGSNRAYWLKKFKDGKRKRVRDKAELESKCWIVLEVWEHELASKKDALAVVQLVVDALRFQRILMEGE